MTLLRRTAQALPAALVLATAGLLATPALAQTRAALVQSVDEPARNPYQETQFNVTCRGTTVCSFTFTTVPAGKRLVVTNIAGYVDTSAGGLPNCFLSSGFGGSAYASLPFSGVRGATTAIGTRIVLTHSVQAYFGPGEPVSAFCQPSLGETMSGGALLMLTGHYVNLP
jgi:hypothetical protein